MCAGLVIHNCIEVNSHNPSSNPFLVPKFRMPIFQFNHKSKNACIDICKTVFINHIDPTKASLEQLNYLIIKVDRSFVSLNPERKLHQEYFVKKLYWVQHYIVHQVNLLHYTDVIMSTMASQITVSQLFAQPFVQAQIKENIKAQRYWPLWGELTGDRWIPRTKGQQCRKLGVKQYSIATIWYVFRYWSHDTTTIRYIYAICMGGELRNGVIGFLMSNATDSVRSS